MHEKILTKNFIFAFLSLFCSAMVMYMLLGTITEYAEGMGTGVMLAGLVSGIYVFGGLCSRLASGAILQKLGWKRLAVIAMTAHFLACCCYFLVDSIGTLILIRFIHGLGFGASANATMTIGMAILPKSRYGEATGYFMMATTLAVAAGPFAGGLVYDSLGPTGCFAMAALLSLLMLVFIVLMDLRGIDPGPHAGTDTRARAKGTASQSETLADAPQAAPKGINKLLEVKAFPISICVLLCAMGYVSIMSFYRLYAAEVDLAREFTYYFLFYGGFLLATRPLAGK
ncbi:MAG: MFS transporter, partial [Firmicutes bacterium]|nr:MFS transporter [Bacillota bacterium]